MKKLLIAAVALLPFLGSCDKDNGNDEPEPGNDTVPAIDTVTIKDTIDEPAYVGFYEYGKYPVPMRFDSLVQLFPNDKFWFFGGHDVWLHNVWVYRGVDTIIDGVQQLKMYYADLYAFAMVKEWSDDGYMRDSAGSRIWKGKTYYDFNLKEGDTFQSKVFADSVDFLRMDSIGYMLVDSIVSRNMEDGSQRRFFYLSSKYARSTNGSNDKFSYAVWVEGIGNLYDNDDIGTIIQTTGGGSLLLRYYEKGSLVYKDDLPKEYGYTVQ